MISYEKLRNKLKEKNITSYTVKKNNIISQSTYQAIMNDKPISTDSLEKLCQILGCDVVELLQYIPDTPTE